MQEVKVYFIKDEVYVNKKLMGHFEKVTSLMCDWYCFVSNEKKQISSSSIEELGLDLVERYLEQKGIETKDAVINNVERSLRYEVEWK